MKLTTEEKEVMKNYLRTIIDLIDRDTVKGETIGAEEATNRGFRRGEFKDTYTPCSIQKSSAAMYDAIWLGVNESDPQIMVSDAIRMGILEADKRTGEDRNGWMPYPVPEQVLMNTRMHLSRDQVINLLPILLKFAATGELYDY